jgi:hypothetical protein
MTTRTSAELGHRCARVPDDRGVEKHVTSILQKLHLPVAADTHRRVLAVVAFLQS